MNDLDITKSDICLTLLRAETEIISAKRKFDSVSVCLLGKVQTSEFYDLMHDLRVLIEKFQESK